MYLGKDKRMNWRQNRREGAGGGGGGGINVQKQTVNSDAGLRNDESKVHFLSFFQGLIKPSFITFERSVFQPW